MEENKELETKEQTTVETEQSSAADDSKNAKSAEEQLAEMRIEMLKLKKALDKSSSETANYKKQLREKQSVSEIEAQEKAEKELAREEKFKAMERELTVSKYEKNFLALGYSDDLAAKSAIAQYDGDTDTLFAIQKEVLNKHEKEIQAKLLKSMPVSPVSNDGADIDAFLRGFGK